MDRALKDLLSRELRAAKLGTRNNDLDFADVMPVVERAYSTGHSDGFRAGKEAQQESDRAHFSLCLKCRGCPACQEFYRAS